MKDINELKDYRLKYKRYYNIEFNSEFVVHHIDQNRSNNDIKNLLLLPKELHGQLHMFYNGALALYQEGISLKDLVHFHTYQIDALQKLSEVLEEVEKWVKWKNTNYDSYLHDFIFINKTKR